MVLAGSRWYLQRVTEESLMRRILTKVEVAFKGRNGRESNHSISRPEGTRGEAVSRTWLQDTGVWQEPRALVEEEAAATARE